MEFSDNDIHLWCASDEEIQDTKLLEQYHQLLSEEERVRLGKFKFSKQRHQYLITRALIRSVLSKYHPEVDPFQWRFDKNEHGKPHVDCDQMKGRDSGYVKFNVSHTEGLVALAVSKNGEIGVDVEYLNRRGRLLKVADRYFSPEEVSSLFRLPVESQRARFFDLWTLKEAYIKACGLGLSIPLSHFSYRFPTKNGIQISFDAARNDLPENWFFCSLMYDELHQVSIAVESGRASTMDARSYLVKTLQITPLDSCKILERSLLRVSIK